MALAISQAENGTRECNRIGITGDIGIFQINPVHLQEAKSMKLDLYNCTDNILFANHKFKQKGWYPWVVFNTSAYKRFLK